MMDCAGELPSFKIEADNGAVAGGGGEFSCAAVYPSPKQSMQLGRQNLHLFRFKNTRALTSSAGPSTSSWWYAFA